MTEVQGYLPPEGPQNVHQVPYRYLEHQGAHDVGKCTIYSPEAVILTGDENAQRELDRLGLEQVSQGAAEAALEAYQSEDPEETAEAVIEAAQSEGGDAEASERAQESVEEAASEEDAGHPDRGEQEQAAEEGTDSGAGIPNDLREQYESDEVAYRGDEQPTLQSLAQAHGIQANQSAEGLIEELEAIQEDD